MRALSPANFLLRRIAMFAWWGAVFSICATGTFAQVPTVFSASPSNMTFAIPTGTPGAPPSSAPGTVTVNVTSGAATFNSVAISGTNAAQFEITGNSCKGTLNAPATCQVFVVFSSSSNALQTATLSIAVAGFDNFNVNLSGAFGAIKLFDGTNIEPSLSGVSFTNLYNIASANLNLSCPAVPTAVISGTPGYTLSGEIQTLGNVFVDNYVVMKINGTPVTTYLGSFNGGPAGYSAVYSDPGNGMGLASPAGNVCQGSDANPDTPDSGGTFPECFSAAYRSDVSNLIGVSADSVANGGLPGGAAAGIPALDVSTLFPTSQNTQLVQAGFYAVDAGGDYASSSLFLVTNCSLAGITPGTSITGNPITNDPNSQTQTFTFDSAPGQHISFTSSEAIAIQNGTSMPNGVIPIVTDIGISQAAFAALIANTSVAPAVCLRLTGEMDSFGNELCKGFLLQCYDPVSMTTTGDNCNSTTGLARDLYDAPQFDSPDAPPGVNFLGSSCSYFLANLPNPVVGSCASSSVGSPVTTLIGPGILMGSDSWLSTGVCSLTGTLTGDVCPLDSLTVFKGAADPLAGSTIPGRNSVYVLATNVPEPFASASIDGHPNGWVNSGSVQADFTANQATYQGTATNPPSNGFTPQPLYSLTYGITAAGQKIPATTFPIPGDVTNYNTGVNPGFVAPLCPTGTNTASSFNSTGQFTGLAEGIYNLHFFATDCALTEGLLFNPTPAQLTDPTANWASFQTLQFGVDTTSPTLACSLSPAAPTGTNGWYLGNVTEKCTATEVNYVAGSAGSGFPPLTTGIQGTSTESFAASTNVTAGPAAIAAQQVSDLAGNPSNTVAAVNLGVDQTSPTIGYAFSAPGTTFLIGQNASTKYTCQDTGSGVANCNGQLPAACSAAPAANPLSFTYSAVIDTTPASFGPHSVVVTTKDCAGNSGQNTVSYTVGAPAADVALFEQETSDYVKPGGTLTYIVWAIDVSAATSYGVNIAESIPAAVLGGPITAKVAEVGCTLSGCSAMTAGTSCTVSSGSVSCVVGTLPTVFSAKGAVVKISVPISASVKPGTAFKVNATVSSDNDPNPKNNSVSDTITVVSGS